MNKKTLFLLMVLALICVFLLFLLFLFGKPNPKNPPLATPQGQGAGSSKTNPSKPTQGVGEDFTSPSAETKKAIDQSYLVSQLIPRLPYRSTNFSFFYSFSTDKFTLYINSAAQNQGNIDFDIFLKQNGVIDRSWVDNLNVVVTSFNPGP